MDGHGEKRGTKTDDDPKAKPDGYTKQALSKLRHPSRWIALRSTDAMAEEVKEKVNDVEEKAEDIRGKVETKVEDAMGDFQQPAPNTGKIHPMTSEYAASVGYAMAQQIATYLYEDEGQNILNKVFTNQAVVVGDVVRTLMVSEDFKRSCRTIGLEVASGSSETLERKVTEAWGKLPRLVSVSILSLIAVSGWFLVLGMTLALWRFALFGLQ